MRFTRRALYRAFTLLFSLPVFGGVTMQTSHPQRIGIIGAGWLGGTVGRMWVEAGHEVMFSSRHPEQLAAMAKRSGPRASVGSLRQAGEFGSIILISVPYDALPQIGIDLQDALTGKIVLDACNPAMSNNGALAREAMELGVARCSAKYLPGTRLVRAFSAVDATDVEASARRGSNKLGVPIASDDTEAIKVVAQLALDAGCEPVIVGDLASATRFQRHGPGFRANTTALELRRLLGLSANA